MLRILGVGLGTVLMASSAMAAGRWDGADELPVSPLACGGGAAADVAAKPYDGGQPKGAPDLNGLFASAATTVAAFAKTRAQPAEPD